MTLAGVLGLALGLACLIHANTTMRGVRRELRVVGEERRAVLRDRLELARAADEVLDICAVAREMLPDIRSDIEPGDPR